MSRFIVFEGLSGTGKTTVARLVAERIGAVFYKTPPAIFSSVREHMDRAGAGINSRFFFYLSGIFMASEEIRTILKTRDVVCDRYVYTTLCFNKAFGMNIPIPEHLLFEQILMPDHVFIVTCREDLRIKRLESRGMTINDHNERKPGIDEKVLSEYQRFQLTEIDNSGNDPSHAVEQIMAHICEEATE